MPYIPEELKGLATTISGYGKRRKYQRPENLERFSDIPEGYETIPGGTEYNVDPSPLARFRNFPGFMGGGQYILDPEQRGELIKSVRKYDSREMNSLREGLPGHLFEIDHKIPLWAGGTDTMENKERLLRSDHARKTKVGTVARTLYYNDKLSLSGARGMLLGWKDKDVEGIDLTEDGKLSTDSTEALSKAIFYSQEWKKPKKIKVGWRDVWSEMKKNPIIRGVQSAVSSFTAGLYKPKYASVKEGKELEATVANTAGNLAGTIASFALIQGFVVQGSRLLRLKSLFNGAQSYKTAIQAGKTAKTIGGFKVSTPVGMKVIQNVVPFTIHGQIAKTFEEEEFRYDGDRVHRFLSDAAFGSLVGVAGNTLKSYAGLGAGVYGLGVLEGASPKESLMNSAIMVGFHGLGHKGRNKLIQDAATREAVRYLSKTSGVKIFPKKINPETKKPYTQEEMLGTYTPGSVKFTEKDANRIQKEATTGLKKNIENNPETYTPEIIEKELSKILTSTRQLYKSSLGTEARLLEDTRDIKSLVKRESANKKTNQDMPEEQYNFLLKEIPKIKNFEKGNVTKTEVEFIKKNKSDIVTGTAPVTGTVKNKETFTLATEEGMRKGSKVIVAMRSDKASVNLQKELNKTAGHFTEMIGNPKYLGEVYYPGSEKLLRTGVLASENRIRYREHSMIPSTYKESEITRGLNKDSIGKAMEKVNVSYLVAEVDKVGLSKKGNPYMTVKIIPESYSISKAKVREKQLPKLTKEGKAVSEHFVGKGSFYDRLSEENKIKLKSFSLVGKEKASDVISAKDMSAGYKHLSAAMFKPLEKAFATNDIKKIRNAFKEVLGMNISKEVAEKFAANKKLNVGKLIETIEGARKRIKTEKEVKTIQEVKSKVAKAEKKKVVETIGKTAGRTVGKLKEMVKDVKEKVKIKKEAKKDEKAVIKAVSKTEEGLTQDVKINKKKEVEIIENKIGIKEDVNKNDLVEAPIVKEARDAALKEEQTLKTFKERSIEDVDKYEKVQNTMILKAFADKINTSLKDARESGNMELVKKLLKYSKNFGRDRVVEIAHKTYNRNNKNFYKAYDDFKKVLSREYKRIGKKDPLVNKRNEDNFIKQFSKGVDSVPQKKLVFEKGKVKTEVNHNQEPITFNEQEAIKYISKNKKELEIFRKENPKAVISKDNDFISIDTKLSFFEKKTDNFNRKVEKQMIEKMNEIEQNLGKDYFMVGLTDKKLGNLVFVRRNDFLVNKFNKSPEKYLAEKEILKGLTNGEKQFKVMAIDVLGFGKDVPRKKVMKRLKLLNLNFQQVKSGGKARHIVLESPTMQESLKLSDKDVYKQIKQEYFTGIKNVSKNLTDGVIAGYQKSALDGHSYVLQKTADTFTKSVGMGTGRNRFKAVVSEKINNKDLFLLKQETSVMDNEMKKLLESKMGGDKIKEGDVITFYDNVKVGESILKDVPNRNYKVMETDTSAFKVKFENKFHKEQASNSNYVLGNLPTDKKLEGPLKRYYEDDLKAIEKITKELQPEGKTLKEVFNEHNISIDGMIPQDILKIEHGAGIFTGNKQALDVVKNQINKRIVQGVSEKGRHLKMTPSINNLAKENEIILNYNLVKKLGFPKQVLVTRDPTSSTNAMLILDVVTAGKGSKTHKGTTTLGNTKAMVNESSAIIKMNADFDGDDLKMFVIGKNKKDIPMEMVEVIKTDQKKNGILFAEEPIKKTGKTEKADYLNSENLRESNLDVNFASEGIGKTASIIRTLRTIDSSIPSVETIVKNGTGKTTLYIGTKRKKLFSEKSFETSLPNGVYKRNFKYNTKEAQNALTTAQRAIDAQTDDTLRKMMGGGSFKSNYFIKELLGKQNFLDPLNSEVKIFARLIGYLQQSHKIKYEKDPNGIKELLGSSNKKIKLIEDAGGEIGPIYKLGQWLEESIHSIVNVTGGDMKARRIQFEMWNGGKNNVQKVFKDRFSPISDWSINNSNFIKDVSANKKIDIKNVEKFMEVMKKANKKYEYVSNKERNGKITKENKYTLQREIRKEFELYWEENSYILNQAEKDAFAYYLATSSEANLGQMSSTYLKNIQNKQLFFSVQEKIIAEASEAVSKALQFGANNISKKTVEQIFEEPKSQTFGKQNVNEAQILSSMGMNKPLKKTTSSIAEYRKGSSPMTQ